MDFSNSGRLAFPSRFFISSSLPVTRTEAPFFALTSPTATDSANLLFSISTISPSSWSIFFLRFFKSSIKNFPFHLQVQQSQCQRGLNDRKRPKCYAWIVPSGDYKPCGFLRIHVNRLLLLAYRRRWPECRFENNRHSVGYASVYASAVVGARADCLSFNEQCVIRIRSPHPRKFETLSEIDSLHTRNRVEETGQDTFD